MLDMDWNHDDWKRTGDTAEPTQAVGVGASVCVRAVEPSLCPEKVERLPYVRRVMREPVPFSGSPTRDAQDGGHASAVLQAWARVLRVEYGEPVSGWWEVMSRMYSGQATGRTSETQGRAPGVRQGAPRSAHGKTSPMGAFTARILSQVRRVRSSLLGLPSSRWRRQDGYGFCGMCRDMVNGAVKG